MTYIQSMKIIARGLIQWPLANDEILDGLAAIKELLWILGVVICRVLALALYPISVPLLTLFVQRMRVREEKQRQEVA